MTNSLRTGLCLLALCWYTQPARAQADRKPAYASKFVNVGDVRIHFGQPRLLSHGGWTRSSFDFGGITCSVQFQSWF